MKRRRSMLILMVLLSTSSTVYGQYEGLNPRHWFPLELGNYWHYDTRGTEVIGTESVITSERDTVVNDQRWVLFKPVYCEGPDCPGGNLWFRFTEDDYLQFTAQPGRGVDTLGNTSPISIFRVTSSVDSSLQFTEPVPELTVVVSIDTSDTFGNPADSTNIGLKFDWGLSALFFVYKIGWNRRIVGARVNGLEVGDISLIDSIVLSHESPMVVPDAPIQLVAYPNPFAYQTTVEIRTQRTGLHRIEVFNVLGQRIIEASQWVSQGRPFYWKGPQSSTGGLVKGAYLIQVTNEQGEQATTTIFSTQ